jgi:hypothetical protein
MMPFPVQLVAINEVERDQYMRHGYNPLQPEEDKEAYIEEWNSFFTQIKTYLIKHWKHGVDNGDFFMPHDWVPVRFLCIEVANEAMLTRDLLLSVHNIVDAFPVRYSVDICDDWVYLKLPNGEPYPHFNIFVEKRRILIYTESDELFKRFGLDGLQQEDIAKSQ